MTEFCEACGRVAHGELTCEQAADMRTTNHAARVRAELAKARERLCPHGVPPFACDEHRPCDHGDCQ